MYLEKELNNNILNQLLEPLKNNLITDLLNRKCRLCNSTENTISPKNIICNKCKHIKYKNNSKNHCTLCKYFGKHLNRHLQTKRHNDKLKQTRISIKKNNPIQFKKTKPNKKPAPPNQGKNEKL